MKELATVFSEATDLRAENKHYEASTLLARTAAKLKLDFDDLLDLFVDYTAANK